MYHYLSSGDQLDGRYEIRETIGRGGMGVVYKAYEEGLDRPVAIKMLLVEYAENEKFIKDFRSEARIIAKWDHPNIVKIYSLGRFRGQDYLVMQFVEGESLEDRLRRKVVSFQELSDFVSQVAKALTYAHERNVVHRDIKPSNILIDEKEDRVYVVDFGLGRIARPDEIYQTKGGGTPAFMAPEQFHGEVSRATDIYGLGITVYRVLTGSLPHEGSSEYELGKNKNERPPKPPSKLNPEITPELEKVILRAIATKPQDRYRTVWEFAEAFTYAVSQAGAGRRTVPELDSTPQGNSQTWRLDRESATPVGPVSGTSARVPRRIWMIIAVALAAAAVVIVMAVSNNSRSQVTEASPTPTSTDTATMTVPSPTSTPPQASAMPTEAPAEATKDVTEAPASTREAASETPTASLTIATHALPSATEEEPAVTEVVAILSTAAPTSTATEVATAAPSTTPTPTVTASPSYTNTPTSTPTATLTRTPSPTATAQGTPTSFDTKEQIRSAIMSDEGEVNCPLFNESYEFLRELFEGSDGVPEDYADWHDPVMDKKSHMNKIYSECKDSDDDEKYVGSDLLDDFMFEEFPSD